ncbi:MAG: Wzt carbohydrate-binding domain-containing protein [Chloroflexi bacterium]|nr:Wzt carbohydrate-binding domain-containing protein [Chloroflexota bacterium]
MSIVRTISDRVLWMKGGQVQSCGDPDEVIQTYLADQSQMQGPAQGVQAESGLPNKPVKIEKVEFINGSGQAVSTLETGQPATLRIYYRAQQRIEHPIFGLAMWNNEGVRVNGPNTDVAGYPIEGIEGCGIVEYQIDFLPLLVGTYWVSIGIFDSTHSVAYDFRHHMCRFTVTQGDIKEMHGLVYMPARWRHRVE